MVHLFFGKKNLEIFYAIFFGITNKFLNGFNINIINYTFIENYFLYQIGIIVWHFGLSK